MYKKQVVETALQEYYDAIPFVNEQVKTDILNMLQNVYIMCSPFNIDGIDEIRQILQKEREQ